MDRTVLRGAAALVAGLVCFAAPRPLLAENEIPADWQGQAGFQVVVTDEHGAPLPGVEVLLRLDERAHPWTGLSTDADGRLIVEGLQPGEWQIDLVREGFMLYSAYVKLEVAKDPEVAFSSRQRTGTYWEPLDAVFLPSDLELLTGAVRVGRDTPEQARKRATRAAKKDREEEERARRRQQRGELARVVPSAEAEIAAAEAEIAAAEPPEPDREAADRARMEPTPGPRLLPNRELRPAGACVECKPGEWSVTVDLESAANPHSLPCVEEMGEYLAEAAPILAASLDRYRSNFTGPVVAADDNDVLRLLDDESRESAREIVDRVSSPRSSCIAVGVVLPVGSRFIGFRYQALDASARVSGECLPGEDCQVGASSWLAPPQVVTTDSISLVYGVFHNRAPDAPRTARLTVYFEPERGWLPPN